MQLKHICPWMGCHEIIDIDKRYCDKHMKEYELKTKQRYKDYNLTRMNDRETRFYNSKEWKTLKEYLKDKYKGMCLYTYLVEKEIVPADEYHHIEPVKDNWDKRLDIYNIIPLSCTKHRKITKIYKTNKKEETQKILRELLFIWKEIKGDANNLK